MFKVYVLYSIKFNKIYVGMTSNLDERFKSHNELSKKGWTKNFRPWIIVFQEEYAKTFVGATYDLEEGSKEIMNYRRKDFLHTELIHFKAQAIIKK